MSVYFPVFLFILCIHFVFPHLNVSVLLLSSQALLSLLFLTSSSCELTHLRRFYLLAVPHHPSMAVPQK
jgi:hypothetical protein